MYGCWNGEELLLWEGCFLSQEKNHLNKDTPLGPEPSPYLYYFFCPFLFLGLLLLSTNYIISRPLLWIVVKDIKSCLFVKATIQVNCFVTILKKIDNLSCLPITVASIKRQWIKQFVSLVSIKKQLANIWFYSMETVKKIPHQCIFLSCTQIYNNRRVTLYVSESYVFLGLDFFLRLF